MRETDFLRAVDHFLTASHLSQKQLAQRAHLSRHQVSKMVRGERKKVPEETARNLATVLNIPEQYVPGFVLLAGGLPIVIVEKQTGQQLSYLPMRPKI